MRETRSFPRKTIARFLDLVAYQKLNAINVQNYYPSPLIEECIDLLGEEIIFLTLEASSDSWQLESEPRNCEKTALTTYDGLFQFRRMSFGLRNAQVTFQRAAGVIF